MTEAERFFVQRRQDPAYERAFQRAWRGQDPELSALRHPVRRLLEWIS